MPGKIHDDSFITHCGRTLRIHSPEPDDITIEDIAHGLGNLCRWGGQCSQFYSVAEHSIRVSRMVPRELALHGLLHDAAEAYLGDVINPLKRRLVEYQRIEQLWEEAIAIAFGLGPASGDEIKKADAEALETERRFLLPQYQSERPATQSVFGPTLHPPYAKRAFMAEYRKLTTGRAL